MPQFPVYNSGAFICSSFLTVLCSLFVLFASFFLFLFYVFCSVLFSTTLYAKWRWWIAECGKCVYQLCRQLRVACIFKWFKRKPIYQWLNTTSRNPVASNSCCSRRTQLKGERAEGGEGLPAGNNMTWTWSSWSREQQDRVVWSQLALNRNK